MFDSQSKYPKFDDYAHHNHESLNSHKEVLSTWLKLTNVIFLNATANLKEGFS